MPTYIGFSTQEVNQPRTIMRPGLDGGVGNIVVPPRIGKKFRLVDTQLVLRDLLNAFSIKQGDKVGQPEYGTMLWKYVFDQNTVDLVTQIENEVKRIINSDPRIILNTVQAYVQENGVLIEIEAAITPFNNAIQVGFFLNRFDASVQQVNQ